MKNLILALCLGLMLSYGCDQSFTNGCGDAQTGGNDETPTTTSPTELEGVKQFIQSTIQIDLDRIIYFDPYRLGQEPHDADIIFITHSHFDHFSKSDLAKVKNDDTILVAPQSMEQSVSNLGFKTVKLVMPGETYTIDGLKFETTFAYNLTGSRHPKSSNWVGYIVTINATRYYIAGDTDFITEMKSVQADVAFLPVGGGNSMDAATAAEAANTIRPKLAVPIHYGVTSGNLGDAEQFIELLDSGVKGYIYSDDGQLLE